MEPVFISSPGDEFGLGGPRADESIACARLWATSSSSCTIGRGRSCVHTGKIESAEALLRWHNPEHGLAAPGSFCLF